MLHLWQVVVGNVRVCFGLAGLGGVAEEAQPGVGREGWWAEIDELVPGVWAWTIQSAADTSLQ